MALHLHTLSFKAKNPLQLAHFWADTLNWEIRDETPDGARLVSTVATPFDVIFLPSLEKKQGKNRIHFDLATTSLDDQTEMVKRLVGHGAHHIDIGQSPDESHVVLADPEGNEFCVLGPNNSFVADRGRLGSITCDGSPEVGYFWSKVLGWPLVWDQDGETAIRSPDSTGPFITWGPPVPKKITNQLRLDVAPSANSNQKNEVERLISLGARRKDAEKNASASIIMTDPDGNEFCVLASHE